jgi:Ni,Fe-hydrogenase I large subunit
MVAVTIKIQNHINHMFQHFWTGNLSVFRDVADQKDRNIIFFGILLSFKPHPYHVGSVEFNYSQKSKTFEITGRFFMDDLENALNKKYKKNLHFLDKKYENDMNLALKNYAAEYLKLKVNNQFLKVNYVGYQEDKESVDIFLECEPVQNPKKIETAVSFIYNLFDDQMNIIHIIVNGQRKTEKLNYPDRYLFQDF